MHPAAPVETRRASLRDPAVVGVVGAGLFTLLRFRDPHGEGSYGVCPFLFLTDHPCPACGGLRAVNDLTRGDVIGAVSSNLLVVVLVAVLAVAWVAWVGRRLRGTHDGMITLSNRVGMAVLVTLVVFGVVRLLPFASWLAP